MHARTPLNQRYWTYLEDGTPIFCEACDVAVPSCECPGGGTAEQSEGEEQPPAVVGPSS